MANINWIAEDVHDIPEKTVTWENEYVFHWNGFTSEKGKHIILNWFMMIINFIFGYFGV